MNTIATPGSVFDNEVFFARVRSARTRVLILDYDGTLAPFHSDPAQALAYPGVLPLLDAIMEAGHTRLAIVSGRSIQDLLPMLKLKRLPEVWGSHGWERRHANGDYHSRRIGSRALDLLTVVQSWSAEFDSIGARIECKPASIAFHWRGRANHQIAEIRSKLFGKWLALGRCDELAWCDFDGGVELSIHKCTKGDAVRTLVAESGRHAVYAYLGDDLADEEAFEAIADHGVSVLVRSQLRLTSAASWISSPDELLGFLARWHETAGGR
jgi:trehalose 6-phosphate phosphatase